MVFWQLVMLESLLLITMGIIILSGTRGIMGAALILTGFIRLKRPEEFWLWEIPFLCAVAGALAFLFFLSKKAGQTQVISGIAGGLASLVVLGAFLTPIVALIVWALIVGTGLVPRLRKKHVLWGMAPLVWRVFLGIASLIFGNCLI